MQRCLKGSRIMIILFRFFATETEVCEKVCEMFVSNL